MSPYVTGTIHPNVESLVSELERIDREYGNEHGKGYPNQTYYIDWTNNEIKYKDGDPLRISFRHTAEYDY
jgi:ribonuclease HII